MTQLATRDLDRVTLPQHEKNCGFVGGLGETVRTESAVSHKSYAVTLVLAIFFGFAGFHRFYVGKVGTGLLWFLTAGMFVFGWLIDIFTVLAGNFTDKAGAWVKPKQRETSVTADGVTKGA